VRGGVASATAVAGELLVTQAQRPHQESPIATHDKIDYTVTIPIHDFGHHVPRAWKVEVLRASHHVEDAAAGVQHRPQILLLVLAGLQLENVKCTARPP
jgi:hypothetical protein